MDQLQAKVNASKKQLEDLDAKLKATSNPDELKKYNDQINGIIAEIS